MPTISATTTGSCACCNGGLLTDCREYGDTLDISVTALCSTRTGTALFCGFSEFVSPTFPNPKKYRRKVYSGDLYSECNNGSGQIPQIIPGEDYYDGCTLVNTSAGSDPGQVYCGNSGEVVYSVSRTIKQAVGTGALRQGVGICSCPTPWPQYRMVGTAIAELTEEDTIDDAMARSIPSAWSVFGGCSTLPTCCKSVLGGPRGAGVFSFSYTQAQLKVIYSGLSPAGGVINIRFSVFTRNDVTSVVSEIGEFSGEFAIPSGPVAGAGEMIFDIPDPTEEGHSNYVTNIKWDMEDVVGVVPPDEWPACSGVLGGLAGQLFYPATSVDGVLVFNYVQVRASLGVIASGVERIVRFHWERAAWTVGGLTEFSDYGYTDVPVVGLAAPDPTWTRWVDVPFDRGSRTHLRFAELLPI